MGKKKAAKKAKVKVKEKKQEKPVNKQAVTSPGNPPDPEK